VSTNEFPSSLRGKLIVSCQAPPGDPLDDVDVLRRMVVSILRGGAGGLRANGEACIRAFRQETSLPIIGILKRFGYGELYITPDFASASAVAAAGADVLALDCSSARPPSSEHWAGLMLRIQNELHKPVLADIATLEEAIIAEAEGADAVATTLYGYTPETAGRRSVNWQLVERLVKEMNVPVIVEGHITRPEEVRQAFDVGAFAVVVGAAITRPETITARFVQAIHN